MTQVLETASNLLAAWTQHITMPEANRMDITIEKDALLTVVGELLKQHWGYLASVTGLDQGPEANTMEVLYHFCSGAAVLGLRVSVERENPTVPTLSILIPSADFLERELHEMFGVEVVGLPDTSHLYLPDDWQDNLYPLRKDAEVEGTAS